MVRFALLALSVLLLGMATTPNAVAQEIDLIDVQQTLLDCGTFNADRQGDGHAETWSYCATPQCGCMCPYVGAGVVVEAAGQERGAMVVASCQSGYATTQGPADGGGPVTVFPYSGGGPAVALD